MRLLTRRPDDAIDDAVRQATASLRGAATAVLVAAVRLHDRARDVGDQLAPTSALRDIRTQLAMVQTRLVTLEETQVEYDRRPPRGAPTAGWQLPLVQTARLRVDEAQAALLAAGTAGTAGTLGA